LEKQVRKSLECYKQTLVVNSVVNSEDQNGGRNADRKACAHGVSDVNKDSISNYSRGHSCYILANSFSTF
jgi:hypothetical protein